MSRARRAKGREENEVEFSRIVAFSDGVFAIAITLLVLQLEVPEHVPGDDLWPALWEQRHDLFAYAISFAVIGRFWVVHHRFFGDVTGFDSRLITLNLFYLAWIVLMPFSSQVLGDHGGDEPAVVLYAVNLIGVILAGTLLFVDARRAGLSRASPEEEQAGRRSALAVAAVFALSIAVAFLVSPEAATYCWLALFFIPVALRFTGASRS
ncbi:MAG TPA: TMEM175 family protein [Solirubrobacterales bacterium]|nr:TMEM175 family protein [Solirubrobacterales bacterium]